METPKLSMAAQRAEDAKMGRKLVERATAELDKNTQLDKGRRVVTRPENKGQYVNIRT